MQAFKLEPAFKDYLWGGTRLKTELAKNTDMQPVAESWELSAHPDGPSTIGSGEYKGMSFRDFVAHYPEAVGTAYAGESEFPVLIKLIDAEKILSLQVHPQEDYAQRVEHEHGKTEMWVVMDSAPDAYLYFGFEKPVTKQEMRSRIADNTLTDVLHKAYCKPGDVFFIPAGTLHAIGAGLLIAEIQQSSNSTYRVYDFGRVGADGKLRELHVEKALDVTETKPAQQVAPGQGILAKNDDYTLECLASCDYFTTRRLTLQGTFAIKVDAQSYLAVLCIEGALQLTAQTEVLQLAKGETAFVPADSGDITIAGGGTALLVSK